MGREEDSWVFMLLLYFLTVSTQQNRRSQLFVLAGYALLQLCMIVGRRSSALQIDVAEGKSMV